MPYAKNYPFHPRAGEKALPSIPVDMPAQDDILDVLFAPSRELVSEEKWFKVLKLKTMLSPYSMGLFDYDEKGRNPAGNTTRDTLYEDTGLENFQLRKSYIKSNLLDDKKKTEIRERLIKQLGIYGIESVRERLSWLRDDIYRWGWLWFGLHTNEEKRRMKREVLRYMKYLLSRPEELGVKYFVREESMDKKTIKKKAVQYGELQGMSRSLSTEEVGEVMVKANELMDNEFEFVNKMGWEGEDYQRLANPHQYPLSDPETNKIRKTYLDYVKESVTEKIPASIYLILEDNNWHTLNEALAYLDLFEPSIDNITFYHFEEYQPEKLSNDLTKKKAYVYGEEAEKAGKQFRKDVEKLKGKLINKAKKKGLYENFGVDEYRELKEKYSDHIHTNEIVVKGLEEFAEWCGNVDLDYLKTSALEEKKSRVDEMWEKMNDDEQFGCQFGMFPSWLHNEYKPTHEEIVELMGKGSPNINASKKLAEERDKIEEIKERIVSGEDKYFGYEHFHESNMADYTIMSDTIHDMVSVYDILEEEAVEIITHFIHGDEEEGEREKPKEEDLFDLGGIPLHERASKKLAQLEGHYILDGDYEEIYIDTNVVQLLVSKYKGEHRGMGTFTVTIDGNVFRFDPAGKMPETEMFGRVYSVEGDYEARSLFISTLEEMNMKKIGTKKVADNPTVAKVLNSEDEDLEQAFVRLIDEAIVVNIEPHTKELTNEDYSRISDKVYDLKPQLLEKYPDKEYVEINVISSKKLAMQLLTKENREILPPLYSQENKGKDAIAYVKFFTPTSNWTWFATEGEPILNEEGEEIDFQFFGLVYGFEKELGYFNLSEMESAKGPFGIGIERDKWFEPKPLNEIEEKYGSKKLAQDFDTTDARPTVEHKEPAERGPAVELDEEEIDEEFFAEEAPPSGISHAPAERPGTPPREKRPIEVERNLLKQLTPMDMKEYTSMVDERSRAEAQGDLSKADYVNVAIKELLNKYMLRPETLNEMSPVSFIGRKMKAHTMLNEGDYKEVMDAVANKLTELKRIMKLRISSVSLYRMDRESNEKATVDFALDLMMDNFNSKNIVVRAFKEGDVIEIHPYFWDSLGRQYRFDEAGIKRLFNLRKTEKLLEKYKTKEKEAK